MRKEQLVNILKQVPDDAKLMSNSGWECNATEMDGVWYNTELNEVHFTQGGEYEAAYECLRCVDHEWRTYHFVRLRIKEDT